MSKMPDKPTRNAVIKYAEQLRVQADKQALADPYARPWYPTTAGVLQKLKRIANERERQARADNPNAPRGELDELVNAAREEAPALTIAWMRARAALDTRDRREAEEISTRALQRHQRRQAQHKRDVEAMRKGLTLGQRLDRCLNGLSTVAGAPAAVIGGDRVHGGEKSQQPPWAGDPHGYARDRAHTLVQRLEALLETAKNRDMETAA